MTLNKCYSKYLKKQAKIYLILLNYEVDIGLIYWKLLLNPIFRSVSKTTSKSKMEIFMAKVKTFITKISMLGFAEVLMPLILLTLCT